MRWILALTTALLTGATQAKDPLELATTLPLGNVEGRIDHLAWDAKNGRLWIAALENNSVEVLDPASGKAVHRIRSLREPQGVAIAGTLVVVASGGDGSCRFYDAETFEPGASVDCRSDADNVRYDPEKKLLYVGFGSGGLAVVDAGKQGKVADIPLDAHPESFQLERKGKRIFVNVPEAGHIAVVDREKRAVTATWKLSAGSNFPMALDEEGHRLYVGCRQPAKLLVFDTETGKELAAVECSGDADDVFFDAARKRVYVACGAGFLDVFDAKPARIAKVPTAAGARTCLYVPDAGRLYLAVPHRGSQPAEIRVFKANP